MDKVYVIKPIMDQSITSGNYMLSRFEKKYFETDFITWCLQICNSGSIEYPLIVDSAALATTKSL